MRTCTIENKPGESLEKFVRRCIKVAEAADQPIVAIHSTTEFIVYPTFDQQVIAVCNSKREARDAKST